MPCHRPQRPVHSTSRPKQRFEDAQFLLEAERTTGVVYLAGYSVEWMLKPLILAIYPRGREGRNVRLISRCKAHGFDLLKMSNWTR